MKLFINDNCPETLLKHMPIAQAQYLIFSIKIGHLHSFLDVIPLNH